MAYLTLGGTAYLIREGQSKGRRLHIENRRRAIDASLLVDRVDEKDELQVEIAGLVSPGRNFTIAEANALIATLEAGSVTVGGDVGSFTARAKDIGYADVTDWRTGSPVTYRLVSVTLEEV